MTPEYIYEDMTPAEVADALDYIGKYELTERHWALGAFKKVKKLWSWLKREKADFDKDIKALIRDLKRR